MPSIFNHGNNGCWGIRRSSYNLFNEQLSFDANLDKPDYSTYVVKSNETAKVNNFHGSSNGYYGYHIPSNPSVNDVAMDTSSEISSGTACEHDNEVIAASGQNSDEHCRRKRCHSVEQQDFSNSKRIKKDEKLPNQISPAAIQNSSESAINNNFETSKGVSRTVHKKMDKIEDDVEFLEFYFRQTHGCELYNFNKFGDL